MPLRRNRRQYEQLTDFDRGRIIGLREAGWSNRRIGRHLGRSDMVVARCWQQWITEGRVYRRGGSGRPRNTNDREDRAIRRVATSAPTTSLASIQRHLPPSRHPVPSRETIRRRLTEVGLRSRRPLRRLPLTPHHRQCRLDFCRPRATWSVTDWRHVIFSDESRFSLSADDHRTRVWRRTGQRSDPAFIVERHTAISQGVTVWGAISWDTRSSLVLLQGTLTARRYVDDILTPIVLPMLSSHPGAIYQQDNARPHTARLSQQCLQGYDVLPWPASIRQSECLSRARVFEWFKRFKDDRQDVEDDSLPGRPSTSKTDENVEKVVSLIRSDRRLSIRAIAETVNIDKECVWQILHDNLNMQKVCAKMVPKILTFEQQATRKNVCTDILEAIKNDPNLLEKVITCDESSCFTYDPETKRQSMHWKTPTSPRAKKSKNEQVKI
ncbi:protein GVQW3 [Trichonephila clavipes]|nr:protein GVQW3 [Trichonephila clavipes]